MHAQPNLPSALFITACKSNLELRDGSVCACFVEGDARVFIEMDFMFRHSTMNSAIVEHVLLNEALESVQ